MVIAEAAYLIDRQLGAKAEASLYTSITGRRASPARTREFTISTRVTEVAFSERHWLRSA